MGQPASAFEHEDAGYLRCSPMCCSGRCQHTVELLEPECAVAAMPPQPSPRPPADGADEALVLSSPRSAMGSLKQAVKSDPDGGFLVSDEVHDLASASEHLLEETTAESGRSDLSDVGCPSAHVQESTTASSRNDARVASASSSGMVRLAPDSPISSPAGNAFSASDPDTLDFPEPPSPGSSVPSSWTLDLDDFCAQAAVTSPEPSCASQASSPLTPKKKRRANLEREDSLSSEELMELWNLDDHFEQNVGVGCLTPMQSVAATSNRTSIRRATGGAAAMFTVSVVKGDNLGLLIKKNSVRIKGFKPSGSIVEYQKTCEPGLDLRAGDRIVAVNGLPLGPEQLVKFLKRSKSTATLAITVKRA
eukprot:TRINITY_DN32965_c0_g1_i1.p1 TRINITY_DN32965_c0_g1~~TRINITY_DN32965_c0_g1_i1.p1  ORF type:complete len:363 (-),score=64.14 TRINITY_DN32965_c0_g1_i1:23-1111(-)